MKSRILAIILAVIVVQAAMGCSSSPKVTRTEIGKVVDLSGNWNDTDSKLVVEEMMKDCLAQSWLNKFNEKNNREPVVIIGKIYNRTSEHISSNVFLIELEKNLLNAAHINFVVSRQERLDVREERNDQQAGLTDPNTVKPLGQETGADFMLQGSIDSVKDEIKGKYVILYQVNLELVDLTNNRKAWIGLKKIKKLVEKSSFSL